MRNWIVMLEAGPKDKEDLELFKNLFVRSPTKKGAADRVLREAMMDGQLPAGWIYIVSVERGQSGQLDIMIDGDVSPPDIFHLAREVAKLDEQAPLSVVADWLADHNHPLETVMVEAIRIDRETTEEDP